MLQGSGGLLGPRSSGLGVPSCAYKTLRRAERCFSAANFAPEVPQSHPDHRARRSLVACPKLRTGAFSSCYIPRSADVAEDTSIVVWGHGRKFIINCPANAQAGQIQEDQKQVKETHMLVLLVLSVQKLDERWGEACKGMDCLRRSVLRQAVAFFGCGRMGR